jgi:DNA polymerase III subunit epsilon
MSNARMIALDTETTGIGPRYHRLTEIAAVEFDPETGLPTGNNFHVFVNPGREVPPEATAVHGFTWEDLKDKPPFAEVADSFLQFIEGSHLVIHNAPFDVGFLNTELKRAKRVALPEAVTDTLALSRNFVRSRRHNLDVLCDRYKIDRSKRTLHGALIDCEMLAAVYPHLLEEANAVRSKINELFPFSLGDDLPELLDENVIRYLQLDGIRKVLEKEAERYKDKVREQVQGSDKEGDFYTIEFANRSKTDWDEVTKAHLVGIDLAPYKTATSAMSIKNK